MSEAIHLFIITDNAERACFDVVGVNLHDLPSFVRIVTEAEEIRRLPEGVRCLGWWFAWGAREHDEAQLAWEDRRSEGGLEGVSQAFFQKLDDWKARRAAAEAKILEEALAERRDAPVMTFEEFANAQAASRAVESETVSVIPKKTRWS